MGKGLLRVLIMHNAGDSALPSGELAVSRSKAEVLREKGVYKSAALDTLAVRSLFEVIPFAVWL